MFFPLYLLVCSPTRMTSLHLILDEMSEWEMRVQSAGWDEWRGAQNHFFLSPKYEKDMNSNDNWINFCERILIK